MGNVIIVFKDNFGNVHVFWEKSQLLLMGPLVELRLRINEGSTKVIKLFEGVLDFLLGFLELDEVFFKRWLLWCNELHEFIIDSVNPDLGIFEVLVPVLQL